MTGPRASLAAVTAACVGLAGSLAAQGAGVAPARRVSAAAHTAFSRATSVALAYESSFPVLAGGRVRLGYLVRGTAFGVASGAAFGNVSPELFGTPQADSLRPADGMVLAALNAAVTAQVALAPRLELGVSLDIAGVTVGGGEAVASDVSPAGLRRAEPVGTNLFRGGRADRGSLNSEFAITWWAGRRTALRAGWSHAVVELTPGAVLRGSSDRYRLQLDRPFAGVVIGL
ncbi:MAG: hypothetical protein NW201_05265 [Gemmatimonadales bacterium]|nr:hypothetical protein [Gemmatimonadales bacterium]